MNPSYQHFATHDESEYPELWEGVIGAWASCLGPSGTRLHDNSGFGRNGTLTNMDPATDWAVSNGQYALDFDGVNDLVVIPSSLPIPDEYTICAWVKIAANRATILGFTERDAANRVSQWGTTGSRVPYFQLSLSGGYFFTTGGTALNPGQWYHLAFTRSGATAKVYVNGVDTLAATTGGATGSMLANPNSRRIGSVFTGVGVFADAMIDDVRIYSRVAFSSEIATLARSRGISYELRRRIRTYSIGPPFSAAWARGANQFIQPSMIGVA